MRRRRTTEASSSLDLLLDTMTNAFGGVLFLAILLSIQLKDRSVISADLPDFESKITRLELQRDELLTQISNQMQQKEHSEKFRTEYSSDVRALDRLQDANKKSSELGSRERELAGRIEQIREEQSDPTAEAASPLPESGARPAIGSDLPLNQQELSLQLQRTAETCKNTHNEAALHQRKLLNALEDLRAKSRRLALRAATPPTGDEDVRSQRLRLISLALDREQTSKSIAQMELQLSALATEQTRANLRRVQQLEQDAQRQIGELEILMSYAATPRLYAPQSGTILRTRPLPESGTFQQDVVFATLQLGASDLHRAVFTASEDALPYLKPGDPITITLSGIGLHSQLLDGEIRTLRPFADTGDGTPAQHLVDVSLSAESEAFLASKSAETAYAGATSSAHITVTLPERPLVQALWRSLEQVSQTAGIW